MGPFYSLQAKRAFKVQSAWQSFTLNLCYCRQIHLQNNEVHVFWKTPSKSRNFCKYQWRHVRKWVTEYYVSLTWNQFCWHPLYLVTASLTVKFKMLSLGWSGDWSPWIIHESVRPRAPKEVTLDTRLAPPNIRPISNLLPTSIKW